jgi:hypothetical protein
VMRVPVLYGSVAADKGNGESAVTCLMDVVMKSQDRGQGGRVKMDHWALRYPTNTEDVGRVCYGEFFYRRLALPLSVCGWYGLAD